MATCDCKLSFGDEYRNLLLSMKSTVEGLLASKSPNVWNTYGGLNRLGNDVDKILSHRVRTAEGVGDYWLFFGGLRVLQPTFAPTLERHRVTTGSQNTGKTWVLRSLEEHTLSKQLRVLLQDETHLKSCYKENAFICQPDYTSAFLVCLDAVEQNRLTLLTEIEPTLLVKPDFPKWPSHSRASSLPINQINQSTECSCDATYSRSFSTDTWKVTPVCRSSSMNIKLRRSFSRDNTTSSSAFGTSRNDVESGIKENSKLLDQRSLSTSPTSENSSLVHQIYRSSADTVKCANAALDLSIKDKLSLEDSKSESLLNEPGSDQIESKKSSQEDNKIEVTDFKQKFKESNVENQLPAKRLRSETYSSRLNNQHDPLKWHWKLWWSNLRRIRSEPELNTVTLLSYHKMDDEFLASCATKENLLTNCATDLPHQNLFDHSSQVENLMNTTSTSSFSPNILKVDYSTDLTPTANDNKEVHKVRQDMTNPSTNELKEEQTEDNTSTNTLCLADIGEDEGPPSHLPFKKSGKPIKASSHWLTHKRSRSDVTPPTFHKESHYSSILHSNQRDSMTSPRRGSLLEEGGRSVLPMTECSFPRPTQGQSLTSFLSSQDFHSCAELDRENNHFSICEALIEAIEQMKWREVMRKRTTEEEEESDEEIQHLKRRIRIRRHERQREKESMKRNCLLLSDGRTDTTTSLSNSPFVSPHSSAEYPESSSTDSVDELVLSADEADKTNQLVALRDNGLSLSMASLYSDADVQRGTTAIHPLIPNQQTNPPTALPEGSESFSDSCASSSAELVALSLLKLFPEKQLPKASELKWVVSEQDVPQQTLLPLPKSWMVSLGDGELTSGQSNTRWRGTLDWAPPRAQIIFNIHPVPQRKTLMAKQNFRCAGCGMKIEINYMKRFRYCEYLGKYFCHCCHGNRQSYIPGRILRKWDFSKYYVSNFSHDLLDKMYYDPLFNVIDINAGLYRRVRALEQARDLRQQLFSLKDFVLTCRHNKSLQAEFERQPPYLLTEIHVYSIHDLLQVKNGEMCARLKSLVHDALSHINKCELCQMKGFICELCNNNQVIFPFQLHNVWQCLKCWACYHKTCYATNNAICPKCKRIQDRKQKLAQDECINSDNDIEK